MSKIKKIEKTIIDFLIKHNLILFIIIMTILSLYLKVQFLNYRTGDYTTYLEKWFNFMKEGGGFAALRNYPGDYNAPYMTIIAFLTYLPIHSLYSIKLVSIVFEFIAAISSASIVKEIYKDKKQTNFYSALTYVIILFAPTLIFNGTLWGQCDIIYTSFVLISLLFLLKKKYTFSFIFLGLSFAFKLQFLFILPLYIYIYINNRNFSIFNFFIIPIVNFVLCVPALIFGMPASKIISVYLNQADSYSSYLTLNFPNIYYLVRGPVEMFSKFGIVFTALIFGILLFIIVNKKIKFNSESILSIAIWSIVISTFFLPKMHERYLFMADIISIIYYIVYRKNLGFVITIQLVSVLSYLPFLFDITIFDMKYIAIVYFAQIIIFSKNIFNNIFNNKINYKEDI